MSCTSTYERLFSNPFILALAEGVWSPHQQAACTRRKPTLDRTPFHPRVCSHTQPYSHWNNVDTSIHLTWMCNHHRQQTQQGFFSSVLWQKDIWGPVVQDFSKYNWFLNFKAKVPFCFFFVWFTDVFVTYGQFLRILCLKENIVFIIRMESWIYLKICLLFRPFISLILVRYTFLVSVKVSYF